MDKAIVLFIECFPLGLPNTAARKLAGQMPGDESIAAGL